MSQLTHWVLIETGGNQRYIFASNRLRHVVGASQLVHEVGTCWVREAVTACGLSDHENVVMTASGKALLLVDSVEAGRRVIREVTTRVLREAPGLQVTGVVGPGFDPGDGEAHGQALTDTYALHHRVRAARPDPVQRDRVFPWHRLCRDTGRPAAYEEIYGPVGEGQEPPVPASADVVARSRARDRALHRLREEFGVLVPEHLDTLRHSGWMAVVHADGNGVGGLFRNFLAHVRRVTGVDRVPLEIHVDYQRELAVELNDATREAVRDAIGRLAEQWPEASLRGRVLPIVVGGDDVTLICDAVLAVSFVRAFAEAFARRTATKQHLSAIARAATGQDHLTASAGIAIVKHHHPFASAYDLAEELTVSAKKFRDGGRSFSGFDFHVVHSATWQNLAAMREYLPVEGSGHDAATDQAQPAGQHLDRPRPVARFGGPYLLDTSADLPEHLHYRSVEHLKRVCEWLDTSDWLSAAQAHALREAADRSLKEYRQQLDLLLPRISEEKERKSARTLLDLRRAPTGEGSPDSDGPFLLLFDALNLHGLRLEEQPLILAPNEPAVHRSAA